MAKNNKQAKIVEAVEAPKAVVETKQTAIVRSMEAINADIDKAMEARDMVACQKLFDEKAKAEKQAAKQHSEYVKANEAKFIEARANFSSYIVETFELAVAEYEKANGSIAECLGDKLNAVRITLAGSIDKAGAVQTNTSAALLMATAKKTASTGTRTGNFHAGERGNLLNSGMNEAQIVEKFGSDDEKASYTAWKAEGSSTRNQRYSLAKKLLKANGII